MNIRLQWTCGIGAGNTDDCADVVGSQAQETVKVFVF